VKASEIESFLRLSQRSVASPFTFLNEFNHIDDTYQRA